jgi:hypothetical protein
MMLSRRLTPGQRLAAMPLFILGGLSSLVAGHMIADHALQSSAIVRPSHNAQGVGGAALAPKAHPTPAATASPTAPHTTGFAARNTVPAAPLHHDGKSKKGAPKESPPAKGGHPNGEDHDGG